MAKNLIENPLVQGKYPYLKCSELEVFQNLDVSQILE